MSLRSSLMALICEPKHLPEIADGFKLETDVVRLQTITNAQEFIPWISFPNLGS